MNLEQIESIQDEYVKRQKKVLALFTYLVKSKNIGCNNKYFFWKTDYRVFFNKITCNFLIKDLDDLDKLPRGQSKDLPQSFDFDSFLGKNVFSYYDNITYDGYIIAYKYYMLYCESLTSPGYFNYFWLYDFENGVKLGQLHSFDKAMELIETAKNEWILQHM